MSYRLVALDVDGTLVGPGPDEVRPAAVAALRRAHAAGVELVIATGRGPRMVRHIAEQLAVPLGMVLANGAIIAESLEAAPIEQRLVAVAVAREAIMAYREAGCEPIIFDDPSAGEHVYYEREHPCLARWLPRNAWRSRRVEDLVAWCDHRPLMVGTFGVEAAIKELAEALGKRLDGTASVQPLFHPKYDQWTLDVFAPDCTKWSGLRRYASHRGVAVGSILAVGDGLNDLPMIEGAGWGVAMGNSDPELLAVADAVVGTFDQDGVAEALARYVMATAESAA